jgi:rRNA maturation endonuclease Nob1
MRKRTLEEIHAAWEVRAMRRETGMTITADLTHDLTCTNCGHGPQRVGGKFCPSCGARKTGVVRPGPKRPRRPGRRSVEVVAA